MLDTLSVSALEEPFRDVEKELLKRKMDSRKAEREEWKKNNNEDDMWFPDEIIEMIDANEGEEVDSFFPNLVWKNEEFPGDYEGMVGIDVDEKTRIMYDEEYLRLFDQYKVRGDEVRRAGLKVPDSHDEFNYLR